MITKFKRGDCGKMIEECINTCNERVDTVQTSPYCSP